MFVSQPPDKTILSGFIEDMMNWKTKQTNPIAYL